MKVHQLETVAHAHFLEHFERLEQFAGIKAELRHVAAALLPLSGTGSGQLDADTQIGAHAQLFGRAGNDFELRQFFNHQEHAFPHFLSQQGQLNKILVLVAVADNQAVAVHVGSQDGMQLGLAARLKTEIVFFSVADDFLYHRAHLIDLDGVYNKVLPLEVILLGRLIEAGRGLFNPIVQDVGKTHQHRSRDVTLGQIRNQFLQVNAHIILARRYVNMALFVDAEVIDTPSSDVVEFLRVFNSPFSHVLIFSAKTCLG
ncbi:unknown [Prevotella sp. CAG:617]|nr:unknown [Prevotella sp. CAG:617]